MRVSLHKDHFIQTSTKRTGGIRLKESLEVFLCAWGDQRRGLVNVVDQHADITTESDPTSSIRVGRRCIDVVRISETTEIRILKVSIIRGYYLRNLIVQLEENNDYLS